MKNIITPKLITVFVCILVLIEFCFNHKFESTMEIVGLLSSVWIAITIHELGHIIFGRIVGFEFVYFITGPIKIEKTQKGITLKENKNWESVGGIAKMKPPIVKLEEMRHRQILYSAGGPIFSFLFSFIGIFLYNEINQVILLYFSLLNAAIFIVTIIPIGKRTDGYSIFSLLRNNEKSIKRLEDMLIYTELISNKEPSEWNKEYIELARKKATNIDNVMCAMMVYYVEIEQHGFQSARKKLDGYTTIPITKQNSKLLAIFIHMQQLAYFLTEDQNNQFKKINHFQQFLSPIEPVSFYRGQAIIACLQNDRQQALKNIEKVKKVIEKNEKRYGFFKVEKTLTNMVENKILSGNYYML
ncbi:M50 family metallopeptidase [Bacillus wiedmannii]|uniref:M50 family metallopeptidase n=1 Tax=Bacillus wiedmannii TaxID=1890302 RepID=UPI000D092BC1|nr:M50 family metallopeptidase [Bacillus wiedmannii]PRT15286.1 hypothetical protein C6360_28315 [Bacillus wiedmannii]